MTGPDGPEACASTSFLFGFAPGGVCRAAAVTGKRGALLPHRFTLTATNTQRSRRRSVLCGTVPEARSSLRSRDPRRTLSGTVRPWSPDFPPRPPFGIGAERPSGRLTPLGMGVQGGRVKIAGSSRLTKKARTGRGTGPGFAGRGKLSASWEEEDAPVQEQVANRLEIWAKSGPGAGMRHALTDRAEIGD